MPVIFVDQRRWRGENGVILALLVLLMSTVEMAEAQRKTFNDANGRTLGRSVTESRGNTTYDDSTREIMSFNAATGESTTRVLDQAKAERAGWFNGPPYHRVEHVINEDDMEDCSPAVA